MFFYAHAEHYRLQAVLWERGWQLCRFHQAEYMIHRLARQTTDTCPPSLYQITSELAAIPTNSRLSTRAPCIFRLVMLAVFLCRAKSDTAVIAEMCLERIELLHDYFGSLGINYRVEICGKYVIMAVCDRPETAVKRAISVIGHS